MEIRICNHEGCVLKIKARGRCSHHYEKLRASEMPRCSVSGCQNPQYAKGVCATHSRQLNADKAKTVSDLKPLRHRKDKGDCGIHNCGVEADTRGYCKRHYQQVQKYNMTEEMAQDLLTRTRCEICGSESSKLVVDHDHGCCPRRSSSCGKCIRGILCVACNSGVGHLKDDVRVLESAVAYLKIGMLN